MIKFSVIVPVFNAERYINRCINSIISQNRADVEIIIVNDGSTDSSAEICNNLSANYDNIKIVHTVNSGVSSARNTGLKQCIGKYITFIDADDWIQSGYFDRAEYYIENFNLDFYQTTYLPVKDSIKYDNAIKVTNFKIDTVNDIVKNNNYNVCAGGGFYKTEIIKSNNLLFPIGVKLAEDQIFLFSYLNYCKLCGRIDNKDYCYYINPTSATKTADSVKLLDSIYALEKTITKVPRFRNRFVLTIIYQIEQLLKIKDEKIDINNISTILKRNKIPFKYCWNDVHASLKLMLILIKLFPETGLYIYKKIYTFYKV